jgi:hypothetical protein
MNTQQRILTSVLGLTATVVVSACSASTTASSPTSAILVPTSVAAVAPAAAAANPASASSTVAKVSANNASIAELQQVFEAAGVSNAARWAREVDEYRPYDTSDTSFAKLRRELAKYNPSPEVVEKIVSTLAL